MIVLMIIVRIDKEMYGFKNVPKTYYNHTTVFT